MGQPPKLALVAVLVSMSACGSASPPLGDSRARSDRPGGVEDVLYDCGQGPFDASMLEGPGDLEHAESDLAAALRALLETPDGTMGGEGWRIVDEAPGRAIVAAPTKKGSEHPYVSALFERSEGEWKPVGWGDCTPLAVVGGRSPVLWRLETTPGEDATELRLLVEERACSSGRELTEDNTRADVDYSDDAIVILMTADPLGGGKNAAFNCIGVAPAPVTVTLEERVAGRRLVDAAVYPPARRDD